MRCRYAILDEGHKIRNPDAEVTLVAKQLPTLHRRAVQLFLFLNGHPQTYELGRVPFGGVFKPMLCVCRVQLHRCAAPRLAACFPSCRMSSCSTQVWACLLGGTLKSMLQLIRAYAYYL